jgi:DNA-binding PadR family transcriptional regulator
VSESTAVARTARSTTAYAILGLLAERNWSTYELAKQVQRSLNWFWPRAERKLYDEPKRLVADGLASAERRFTGQRPRTVYEITPDGRRVLREWLGEPSAPRSSEFEAMLKVFFADAGSLEQLTATIIAIEESTADRMRELAGMAAATAAGETDFPDRQHISALALNLQHRQELAVLSWARWAQVQIAGWRTTTDPGGWSSRAALGDLIAEAGDVLDAP